MADLRLVVGLGNPGGQYEKTRHNIGWMVLDRLADRAGWSGKGRTRDAASVAMGRYKGLDLTIVKPLTFMNESGLAVRITGVRRERLGWQERKGQDVGRAVGAEVDAFEGGQLRIVGDDQADRGRRRGTAGRQGRRDRLRQRCHRDREIAARHAGADDRVDPPRPAVDRVHAPVPVPVPRRDSSSTTLFCG